MIRKTIKCDLLVVGAGPAGSVAAGVAASHGLDVLLIDKKKRLGEKPHCGEFIPQKLLAEFNLSPKIIQQQVDFMETIIFQEDLPRKSSFHPRLNGISNIGLGAWPGEKREEPFEKAKDQLESLLTPSPGYIIDRQVLDMSLAKDAASNGALVLCDARLLKQYDQSFVVRHQHQDMRIEPRIVIAADGPNSAIAGSMSSITPEFLVGVQYQVPLTQELKRTTVFFHKEITHGYGWIFPKGMSANLGLGMLAHKEGRPKQTLDFFLDFFIGCGAVKPGIFSRSIGLIPLSGIRNEIVRGNIMLVGDAAGLTHPVTGAGVPQAMISGREAALVAVEAIKRGKAELLESYEKLIRSLYSGPLNHAVAKRKLMTGMWKSESMKSILSETWIAFGGYRKRVRERTNDGK